MASRKMKYASLAGAGLLTVGLVGCGAEPQQSLTLGDKMTQSGVQKIENSAVADKCKEYELQKDGSYKCEPKDTGSSGGSGTNSALWFFNGMLFANRSQMTSSSDYKANNLVSGTKNSFAKTNSTKSNTSNSSSKVNLSKSGSGSGSGSKSGGFGSGGRGSSGGS